ncbi:hypothetical protein [Sphingobium phenoxybenzoativorans]|uniref:hypothetical protein n=1 Tax=Sphingobium phenoxybenzoativorans TaxID=1592790 RepID=UPI0008732CA7|nr:hypothetical protein [Sphingobium phenoxybenzoativorans]
MRKISPTMRGLLAASALFLVSSPAWAGDEERALAAIAQAQGKIDAAVRMKGGGAAPETIAKAQASVRMAKEYYKSGKEQKAIESAVEAQQFADTAIGENNQSADLNTQAQQESTAAAQQEAVNANARADAAEQAAKKSAAEAQVARAVAAQSSSTTVTTETVKSGSTPKRKVVKTTTPTRTATTETTTTTVSNP